MSAELQQFLVVVKEKVGVVGIVLVQLLPNFGWRIGGQDHS